MVVDFRLVTISGLRIIKPEIYISFTVTSFRLTYCILDPAYVYIVQFGVVGEARHCESLQFTLNLLFYTFKFKIRKLQSSGVFLFISSVLCEPKVFFTFSLKNIFRFPVRWRRLKISCSCIVYFISFDW